MLQTRVEKGMRILFDAKSGAPFRVPVGSPWMQYITSGRFTNVANSQTLPNGTTFSHALVRQGAWKGRPAYVVGGGPSLKGFDFSKLRGHLTIATNRAFEYVDDPSLFVTLDYRYLRRLTSGGYGDDVLTRFAALKCPRLVVRTEGESTVDGVDEVPRAGDFGLSESLSTGVFTGRNSGFVALTLAYLLGANPIYLLGFDMGGAWHHDGHPWPTSDESYATYRRSFEVVAEQLARAKVEVVNLCPSSALNCFAKRPLDVEPSKLPTFVSYHTPDEVYRAHADRLRRSLVFHGVPHLVRELPASGTWEENCARKASFLRDIMPDVDGPIVWTDADSTVERHPGLFEEIDADVAVHRRGEELLSGTIYFKNNARSRRLVAAWAHACELQPKEWDQVVLKKLIDGGGFKGLKTALLPAEYCCINDTMRGDKPPVVLHWQASRETKRETT